MATQDARALQTLVRTSVLIPEETDKALRELAEKADRPISREIRRAIDAYVEQHTKPGKAA